MRTLLKGKLRRYAEPMSNIEMNWGQTSSNIHIKRPVSRVVNQAIFTKEWKYINVQWLRYRYIRIVEKGQIPGVLI